MTEAMLPLAYLPGASGRSQVWQPIARKLSGRRPPVLIDYPGLSDTPLVTSLVSIDDLAHYVAKQLPLQCDLVALSMGCSLALRLVLAYPERIRRLVLVAAAGGVDVIGLGGLDWRPLFREWRPHAPGWFLDDTVDLTPKLSAIAQPTLLVFGDADRIAPLAVGQHLQLHLPNAKLEVIPGATHDLEVEQTNWLASLIEAHLRR